MANENKKYDAQYYNYLDGLRESGVTNMWGAGAYLIGSFGIDKKLASDILGDWMRTFKKEK